MSEIQEYSFDPAAGYAAVYTEETIREMEMKKKGRVRIRYNIVRLDRSGDEVVISDITFNQLQAYRTKAERQGTKIW